MPVLSVKWHSRYPTPFPIPRPPDPDPSFFLKYQVQERGRSGGGGTFLYRILLRNPKPPRRHFYVFVCFSMANLPLLLRRPPRFSPPLPPLPRPKKGGIGEMWWDSFPTPPQFLKSEQVAPSFGEKIDFQLWSHGRPVLKNNQFWTQNLRGPLGTNENQ